MVGGPPGICRRSRARRRTIDTGAASALLAGGSSQPRPGNLEPVGYAHRREVFGLARSSCLHHRARRAVSRCGEVTTITEPLRTFIEGRAPSATCGSLPIYRTLDVLRLRPPSPCALGHGPGCSPVAWAAPHLSARSAATVDWRWLTRESDRVLALTVHCRSVISPSSPK